MKHLIIAPRMDDARRFAYHLGPPTFDRIPSIISLASSSRMSPTLWHCLHGARLKEYMVWFIYLKETDLPEELLRELHIRGMDKRVFVDYF